MKAKRRNTIGGIAATLLATGALALSIPTFAGAATTGYPGTATTTTTTAPTTTATTGAPGTPTNPIPVSTGATVTIVIGNGATVISVAGFAAGSTATITIDGQVVSLKIIANAQGELLVTFTITDPHIVINGSTPIVANTGANSVTLSGTGPSGNVITKTFTVNIPATAATTTSSSSSSSLAFTGADIAATVVGGLALIAMGTLLVVLTRRRAHRQHS